MERLIEFSDRAKAAMRGKKHYVYPLSGKRLYDFGGDIIESGWHRYQSYFAFENTQSILSEVSFDPLTFVIPLSHSQPFEVQLQMAREYEAHLKRGVPDVRVAIGNITDYVELYRLHLRNRPQDRLLGRHRSIRTSTRIFEHGVIHVGPHYSSTALYIDHGNAAHREGHIFIAPLIVPEELLTNDSQTG